MKLRIISDLHVEFSKFKLQSLPDDNDTILIIAGDFCVGKKARTYLDMWQKRFHKIIYVLGNHEFYTNRMYEIRNYWKEIMEANVYENVYILDNDYVEINGVIFFGSTFWTNLDNNNPIITMSAKGKLNDFRCIYKGNALLRPIDTYEENVISVKKIEEVRNTFPEHKIIVVTHHMPSFKSVKSIYRDQIANFCYASALDNLVLDIDPILWIHGHTHHNFDYEIGNTRILCNPRGYVTENRIENKEFNQELTIDI